MSDKGNELQSDSIVTQQMDLPILLEEDQSTKALQGLRLGEHAFTWDELKFAVNMRAFWQNGIVIFLDQRFDPVRGGELVFRYLHERGSPLKEVRFRLHRQEGAWTLLFGSVPLRAITVLESRKNGRLTGIQKVKGVPFEAVK